MVWSRGRGTPQYLHLKPNHKKENGKGENESSSTTSLTCQWPAELQPRYLSTFRHQAGHDKDRLQLMFTLKCVHTASHCKARPPCCCTVSFPMLRHWPQHILQLSSNMSQRWASRKDFFFFFLCSLSGKLLLRSLGWNHPSAGTWYEPEGTVKQQPRPS